MDSYARTIHIRWADLDPNGHVRHSVYYDYGAQLRIAYLEQAGVGIGWMKDQGLGPVLFREEARFLRELHFGDEVVIDVQISGLSHDHRKWSMRHHIRRGEELCATLDLDGAWLDLNRRRIVQPPQELLEKFESLPRTEDFRVITSGKGKSKSP